ncbi:MAG TPA: amino acid adenylation domain-containing protein, partial [Thermoanaerobaculia bacterium]|nr:amino acid adenylation domain-containing protein [Thermoanaerobaculia bacterium]
MLSAEEREQLLVEWNDTARAFPETDLYAAFGRQVELHPDLPAVVAEGEALTYGELDRRAGQLAASLRSLGVGPEVPVALYFERSASVLVAILGVLQAGGAYLPLDPNHPVERLVGMLEGAGRPLLVSERRLEGTLTAAAPAVLWLDEIPETGESMRTPVLAGNLAYVLHTSGSTGRPKGVGCTHRNVLNLLADFARRQPLLPGSRGSLWTSLSFDVSVYEIFSPLLAGGAVHLVPEAIRQDTGRFLDWLIEERIDSAYIPPFMVAALCDRLERTGEPASLRRLLVGVEPIPEPLLARVAELCPGLAVINGYGPTEATICATLYDVDPRRSSFGDPPVTPIGRPAANTGIYLLDRHQEPVPVGVPGELYIAGAGLARGYLERPDATAERFVPHPWSSVGGERMYRTGDLVRRRTDGNLEFLGRIDHQIKLRGFRIEPGEIEAALLAQKAVREAVVTVWGSAGHRRLVAYVVGAEGRAPASSELREHLRERLPAYMVPAAFVALPALPLTSSGKLDRKALPEPGSEETSEKPVAPRTPAEELLAAIFAEVLGVGRVGIAEDFFALGGHSLLATQVASRVRSVFGVELPVRAIFETATVEGLAGRLGASAPVPSPILRISREEPLPLSFAQQRLWFLDQLEPGSPLYNIPVVVELTGRLDRSALAAALSEVVRRHEVLRTTFPAVAGEPVQVVSEPDGFVLPLLDLQGLPEDEASRRTAAEARRPFDLANGPLLRAALLKLGAERHALFLNLHHIVSDGWSMGVLVREIGALYAAFREGHLSPLPELAVQYADFAAWQRGHLSGERLESELAWWRGQLAGIPPALDLPTDHPRPAVRSARGAVHGFAIQEEGLAGLTELSRRHGVTLFMTLLAGFAGLLSRFTAEDDLVVATPIAGRTRIETEPLIGLFVNTLVLRADLSGSVDFVELLGRVRETTLSAYAHQEVPFERLVEELAPERDLSRPPLVQVLFALQNAPSGPLELPGLALAASPVETGTAKFELGCTLAETEQGLEGTLGYSRDLFEEATIERWAGHLVRLLAGAAADPRRRLPELPLLSEAEQEQLTRWNDTGVAAAVPWMGLSERFAFQAALRPEALAVTDGERELTYGELDRQANRLARALRRAGVRTESRVAISMERSLDQIVAVLAALKAGGAFVVLDPAQPERRLQQVLADAAPAVVLTQLPSEAELESEEDLDLSALPEQLAYVVYTSGSTGTPTGIQIAQRSVVNLLAALEATVYDGLDADVRVSLNAPLYFDGAIKQLIQLFQGRTLCLVPEAVRPDPEALSAFLAQQRVDIFDCTPAQLQGGWMPKRVLVGGEAVSQALWDRLREIGETEFWNVYGPSECTVDTSVQKIAVSPSPGIGGPLANVQVHVLDAWGGTQPPGVPGELCVGGEGLARGYLNYPELTAERFAPNPFAKEPGARLYRTGDLARWRADGTLEFLGRIDDQVKLRGFRIELGEIEAALRSHPAVREAAVVLSDGHLVAFVMGEAGALREFLRDRLPGYMVPAFYQSLPELPLTPSGKVDRRALAKLRPEQVESSAGMAPRTPVEELMAGIFAEVLHLPRVGIADDFFALGGHSLLATQVTSRVRSVFGVELPVRAVFEAPTVEGLAVWLGRSQGAVVSWIERIPREKPLVLSFAQQRLWFLDRLEPGSPLYNIPAAVELSGRLDRAALAAALGEVVRRHEALRTAFSAVAGEPVQVVSEPAGFPLPLIDLEGVPEEEANRLALAEARRPFDLARGPLLRAALLRLGAERHMALLTMHHIVSDGWSTGVLVRELGALYAAFLEGLPSPLPELAIQYADFAAWQRRHLSGERLESELAWWRERLAGMPPALDLPTDHPRPAVRSARGATHGFAIDGEGLAGLTALSRRHGATLFMTLLAGFATLLQRITGEDDLGVGTPIAGRTRVETEPLIGLFVNTLVLRADLSGEPDFAELLVRVREATLSAYAHQEVPFERLIEDLAPERDLARPPLVQVLFS